MTADSSPDQLLGIGADRDPVQQTDDDSLPVDHADEVKQHDDHDDDGHDATHDQSTCPAIGLGIVSVFRMTLHHNSLR